MNCIDKFVDFILVYRFVVIVICLISVDYEPFHLLLKFIFELFRGNSGYYITRYLLTFLYFNSLELVIVVRSIRVGFRSPCLKVKFFIILFWIIINNICYCLLGFKLIFEIYPYVLLNLFINHIFSELVPRFAIDGRLRGQHYDYVNQSV